MLAFAGEPEEKNEAKRQATGQVGRRKTGEVGGLPGGQAGEQANVWAGRFCRKAGR